MTSAVKIRAGLIDIDIDIDIDIEHMPVPDLAGSLLRGSSSTAAGCGLMFFVIFALSGGYGSGYERSYSGLFMDLLCSDFLCLLCFSVWMSSLFWLRSWASFIGGSFGVFCYLRVIWWLRNWPRSGVFWIVYGLALL